MTTTTVEVAHVAPLRLSTRSSMVKMNMAAPPPMTTGYSPPERPGTPSSLSIMSTSTTSLTDPASEDASDPTLSEKKPKREKKKKDKKERGEKKEKKEKTKSDKLKRPKKPKVYAVSACPSCGFELPLTPVPSPSPSPSDPTPAPVDGSSSDSASIAGSTAASNTSTADSHADLGVPTPQATPKLGHQQPSDAEAANAVAALAAAHRRIAELESQVRLLNEKAAAAVDRWADFEDEISKLREDARREKERREEEEFLRKQQQQQQQLRQLQASPPIGTLARPPTSSGAPLSPAPSRNSFFSSTLSPNRFTSFLSPRRSVSGPEAPASPPGARHQSKSSFTLLPPPPPKTPPPPEYHSGLRSPAFPPSPSPSATDMELIEALTREQTLRHAAEGRLSATSKEVEELSVALFEQANTMVSDERRARARLEERVEILERRDQDKRKRLERLETAMVRIEKVREMLGVGGPTGGAPMVSGGAPPAAPVVPVTRSRTNSSGLFGIGSFVKGAA